MTTTKKSMPGIFCHAGRHVAILYHQGKRKYVGSFAEYAEAEAALLYAKANLDIYFPAPIEVKTDVVCPFHWAENRRPSIFVLDPKNFPPPLKAKRVDLTPNRESHITTRSESDRTLAIAGRRLMY